MAKSRKPNMMDVQRQSFRGKELAEQVVTAQDKEQVQGKEQPSLLQLELAMQKQA